jgi:hypothetical protein
MRQRHIHLRHAYVEFIPETLEPGYLYISRRFNTVSHLCCCGCKSRVVTPLNPSKWQLIDHGKSVSLYPSIGNGSFPCKSHYFINHSNVRWVNEMSTSQIQAAQRRDFEDAYAYSTHARKGLFSRLGEMFSKWLGGK